MNMLEPCLYLIVSATNYLIQNTTYNLWWSTVQNFMSCATTTKAYSELVSLCSSDDSVHVACRLIDFKSQAIIDYT